MEHTTGKRLTKLSEKSYNGNPKCPAGSRTLHLDNIFVERLWRSLKYECVYLHSWEPGSEAKAGIRKWMTF